jgi:hypothetical protein
LVRTAEKADGVDVGVGATLVGQQQRGIIFHD